MNLSRHVQPRAFTYVEVVARLGSIRRAAEALNTASSAINRMLLELERELGTPLFERLPRGMRLTAAGEFLLAHIKRGAAELENVRGQIGALRGIQRGNVQLAAIEASLAPFLGGALARFHLAHRLVSYRVKVMGAVDVADAILAEQADLGLTVNPPASSRLARLASAPYYLHAFVGKQHPLAKRRTLRLSECVGFPVAMGDESLGGRQRLERAFEQTALDFRPFLWSNSIALMMAIGAETDAVCFQILPRLGRRATGSLVAIPLADVQLRAMDLALIANKRRSLSTAAAALAEQFIRLMREQAA